MAIIDPTTSIEIWCAETIRTLIATMAQNDVFKGVQNSRINPLIEQNVILRAYRRPGANEKTRSAERIEESPCCIVTYVGHHRPVDSGENDADDGMLSVIVQICDDADEPSIQHLPSYLAWMEDIRRRILKTPGTRLSPLESMPSSLGQVYLVHVTENKSPDETDWAFHEQMRTALVVQCYTRTER